MINEFNVRGELGYAILKLCNGEKVECINQKIQTDLCYNVLDFGILEFECLKCEKVNSIDILHHLFKSRTHINYIQNEDLLKEIGKELQLNQYKSESGKFLGLQAQFCEDGLGFGYLLYKQCYYCSAKYLTLYKTVGDPGRIPFYTTIYKIWEIEVDEDYFIQFFKSQI